MKVSAFGLEAIVNFKPLQMRETQVVEASDGTRTQALTLVGGIEGDVQAQMQTIEFDTLQFHTEPGFTPEDNEGGIRLINDAILSTYEYRNAESTGDGDWSADLAIDTLKWRYAVDPGNSANQCSVRYVPPGWSSDQILKPILIEPNCTVCHAPNGGYASLPIHYTPCSSADFNGNEFLYRSVLARVNFKSPLDSLFLRKPSNGSTDPVNRTSTVIQGYHEGGYVLNEDAEYSTILSWILNGAPSGAVPAANTIAAGTPSCTTNL